VDSVVQGLSSGGDGVFGVNIGSTGIGVHGKTGGTGSAVFGEATGNRVGVSATSAGGTAVCAKSDATSGIAGYFTAPNSLGTGVYANRGKYGV
jgi:hypothetical protein